MMNFHVIKSKLFTIYVVMGLRVDILRFLCLSIFFMEKNDFLKYFFHFLEFLGFLAWKKYLHMEILKLQLLGP